MPITSNTDDVIASMRARMAKLDGLVQEAAMQMGVEVKNISLGLPSDIMEVDTGNWRDSIQSTTEQVSDGVWKLTFGSPGAFAKDGYDYGALREYLKGPIAISWFMAQDYFQVRWAQVGEELAE
jgi:hypothetical protein